MECQWQSWGMMIDDPDGGHSSILNMAHVDIDQDGLPETQRIPKILDDLSRVWIPNKHCIELSQHFPSNVYPDVGNTMEHLPPLSE